MGIREQAFATPLARVAFTMPRWGDAALVAHEVTGADADEIGSVIAAVTERGNSRVMAAWVCRCLYTADGQRVFEDGDFAQILAKMPHRDLRVLFQHVAQANGMEGDQEKNSDAGPSDASPSA